ncbi:MAG: hypothetical protein GY696_10875 [Gammaproteobacteria bacterium]|nr:hypothetical protein [Gammaproteobacteria bacterium]
MFSILVDVVPHLDILKHSDRQELVRILAAAYEPDGSQLGRDLYKAAYNRTLSLSAHFIMDSRGVLDTKTYGDLIDAKLCACLVRLSLGRHDIGKNRKGRDTCTREFCNTPEHSLARKECNGSKASF